MKSGSAVKHQLNQVIFRYIKKQLRENFRVAPETCSHNKVVATQGVGQVGVCFYEAEEGPRKVICDSLVLDGAEQARICPMWKAVRTKEAVKREFRKLILQGDKGVIASRFPDIAALLWVLDTDEDRAELEAAIQEAPEEDVREQSAGNHPPRVPVDAETRDGSGGAPRPGSAGDLSVPGDEIEGRGPVG